MVEPQLQLSVVLRLREVPLKDVMYISKRSTIQ